MSYQQLIEELENIYTELSYNSRLVRVAMFHLIGKTILENEEVASGKVEKIALRLNLAPDDIGKAILFANKYPEFEDYNHDKTVSWDQVKRELNEDKEA